MGSAREENNRQDARPLQGPVSLSDWMATNSTDFREQFRIEEKALEAGMRALLGNIDKLPSGVRGEAKSVLFDTLSALIVPKAVEADAEDRSNRLTVTLHMPWRDTSHEPMAFDDIQELAFLQRRSGYSRSGLSRAGEKHDPQPIDLTASRVAPDHDH